jgi:hypothetical protein
VLSAANSIESAKSHLAVFVSHSSADIEISARLVALRSAFHLRTDEIRCTSLNGYRLKAGPDADTELRDEVVNAKTVVGILSPAVSGRCACSSNSGRDGVPSVGLCGCWLMARRLPSWVRTDRADERERTLDTQATIGDWAGLATRDPRDKRFSRRRSLVGVGYGRFKRVKSEISVSCTAIA